MKKMNKCEHGYIKWEKQKKLMAVILYVIIGVAIFVTGYLLNDHSKSNVFTVVAVVLVLPAAKHAVAFIILAPYHTLAEDAFQNVIGHLPPEAVVLTDYVFSSPEKVMGLAYLMLYEGNAIGLVANDKQELNYMNTYLGKGIHDLSPNYHVKIVADETDFLRLCDKANHVEITDKQQEAVEAWVRSLAV